jgi:hypothetical protein
MGNDDDDDEGKLGQWSPSPLGGRTLTTPRAIMKRGTVPVFMQLSSKRGMDTLRFRVESPAK